jgi:hypothetical protein
MAEVIVPNTFSNGQVADADQVNQNFTVLADAINSVSGNAVHASNLHPVALSGDYSQLTNAPVVGTDIQPYDPATITSGNATNNLIANGGSLDNVVIGGTTPASGTFSTVSINQNLLADKVLTSGNVEASGELRSSGDAKVGGDLQVMGEITGVYTGTQLHPFTSISTGGGYLPTHSHVLVDCSTGNITRDLPDASLHTGKSITVKVVAGSNQLNLWGSVDAGSGVALNTNPSMPYLTLFSNGQKWLITGSSGHNLLPEPEYTYDFTNDGHSGYDIWAMDIDDAGNLFVSGRNGGPHFAAKVSNQGQLIFTNESHGGDKSSIASDGTYGYTIGWGGPVAKFRNTATPLGVTSGSDGSGYSIDASDNGNIYIFNNDGVRSLGSFLNIRWTFAIPNGTHAGGHIMSEVLVGEDGYIYFVGVDWTSRMAGFVYKLDPSTGTNVWGSGNFATFNTGSNAQDAKIAVLPDGTIYVSASGSNSYSFDSSGNPTGSGSYVRYLNSYGGQLYGSTNNSTFQFINTDFSVAQNFPSISVSGADDVVMNDKAIYVGTNTVIVKTRRNLD